METIPLRSHATELSDDVLILLDALAKHSAPGSVLRRKYFEQEWNFGYSHSLDDAELRDVLLRLRADSFLRTEKFNGRTCWELTQAGGRLWAAERHPIWKRYATHGFDPHQGAVEVQAFHPSIADQVLELGRLAGIWDFDRSATRLRTLIETSLRWHPFQKLCKVTVRAVAGDDPDWAMYHRERMWWQCVTELQSLLRENGCPRYEDP